MSKTEYEGLGAFLSSSAEEIGVMATSISRRVKISSCKIKPGTGTAVGKMVDTCFSFFYEGNKRFCQVFRVGRRTSLVIDNTESAALLVLFLRPL